MGQIAMRLRPKVERDGEGLTELEFVLAMVIELGMLKWEQVRPFIKQFRTLDVDRSGRLGMEDLKLIRAMSPEELEALRRQLGQSDQGVPLMEIGPLPRRESASDARSLDC